MTRGMLVTVLYRMNDSEEEFEQIFNDVSENEYYAIPITWASKNGIVNGVGNNIFAPNKSISREDLATILYRYITKYNLQVEKEDDNTNYSDEDYISNYAKDSVKSLSNMGIIKGKNDNKFDPKGQSTRAEVATILMRLHDLS